MYQNLWIHCRFIFLHLPKPLKQKTEVLPDNLAGGARCWNGVSFLARDHAHSQRESTHHISQKSPHSHVVVGISLFLKKPWMDVLNDYGLYEACHVKKPLEDNWLVMWNCGKRFAWEICRDCMVGWSQRDQVLKGKDRNICYLYSLMSYDLYFKLLFLQLLCQL